MPHRDEVHARLYSKQFVGNVCGSFLNGAYSELLFELMTTETEGTLMTLHTRSNILTNVMYKTLGQ